MRFDLETLSWEYEPPSSCYLGGSAGEQSSSGFGQGTTTPVNFQNPSFVNAAPGTIGQLSNIAQGSTSGVAGGYNNLNPFSVAGNSSQSPTNPLVAQITPQQQQTLGGIGTILGQTPQTLSGAFGLLNQEVNPGFAASLATSPQTQSAIQSAIAPITNTFQTQTVPGLQGSFTQAGQRVGSSSGQGSSAFDNAFAAAQGNELSTEAATAGSIANNAYQTGLNITANAPAQLASLNSSELNDMISGLNAQALPQLTQQYGITAGTQLYQQQMSTILQALGLGVQGEQPALGYFGQNSSQSQGQGTSGGFSLGQLSSG